tara:strand:+ start:8610 stop:9632 length:1023 start_codon:yes stop_codon:yes gene_type:complete
LAEVLIYVNGGSTAGGDGTTNGTAGATRAYASMIECEAAEDAKSFAASSNWPHIMVEAGTYSEKPTFDSAWDTSTTYPLVIEANSSSRNLGVPGDGVIFTGFANFAALFRVQSHFTIVDGIEFVSSGTSTAHGLSLEGTDSIAIRCIGEGKGANGNGFFSTSTTSSYIFCLGVDGVNGFKTGATDDGRAYNCTSGNNTGVGFTRAGTTTPPRMRSKNCVSYGATDSYQLALADYFDTANCEYNATDDTVTTNVPGTNAIANIVAGDFTDTSTNDWTLASGSALGSAGVDLTTEIATRDLTGYTIVLNDITDTAVTNWSIGAFDAVVASGGGNPYYYYAQQ